MKKLFFFRSSGSSNSSLPSTEKTSKGDLLGNGMSSPVGHKYEDGSSRSPRGFLSKAQKHSSSDNQNSDCGSILRRSHSMSSASFLEEGFEQSNMHNYSCHQIFTHERQSKVNRSSRSQNDSSENSSNCSSNVSSKIVDLYIDGEQNQDRSRQKNTSMGKIGKEYGYRPSRAQFTAPSSPIDSAKNRPRSQSFREAKGTSRCNSYRDCAESGLGHGSPHRLAKTVIERLCQTTTDFPRMSSKGFGHDIPITIDDIHNGSLSKHSSSEVATRNSSPFDEPYKSISCVVPKYKNAAREEEMDFELQRRYKEAKERVALFSEELEQDRFVLGMNFDVSALIRTIRSLSKEKMSLAMELSELLKLKIAERACAKEELRLEKMETQLQTRKLEREMKELQAGLEKELDRRSSDWSLRLEKYQFEEQRLRERVRELAEQNVSLQRKVAAFGEREAGNRNLVTYSEKQVKELTVKLEELTLQNEEQCRQLSELREKCKAAEENEVCVKRNFQEKEKECKDLHRSVARLLRTINEQEKTIEGLREGFSEEIGKFHNIDEQVAKLRMELMRLTGVELALRQESESRRLETESLQRENINLLNRLKGNCRDPRDLMFQLDNELLARVCCLQSQGLSLLSENSDLCSKLLAFVKEKSNNHHEATKQGIENVSRFGLDAQFILESDVKIRGFKHGIESLTRSLQTVSNLLQEKAKPPSSTMQPDDQTPEDALRSELKAESLVTCLLREKLYSKEIEVEQLQAELATAVRGTDILKYEVQNALDNLACATHKLRDLELQMLKKDESINRLQSDLQDSKRELNVIRGILPKVSEERDRMWEKVKDYSEKNMLLSSEVDMLKKKVDALDEDILIKEGEITILKDTISKESFSLLSSPDLTREFLLG